MSLTAGRDYKTRAVPGTAIGAARQAYFLGNISAVELERTLERLCIEVRHRARREIQCRLTDGLSSEQRQQLDDDAAPGRDQPELARFVTPDARGREA
jgi:hypothetical protein